ncbi:MAG: NAD(P)H-hydrate dehydratase [Planctomycetota bacterium]
MSTAGGKRSAASRAAAMPRLRRPPRLADDAHKGDAGRVLCVAGSETMPGAAVLVARSAGRAGAGLVCIGCLDDAPFRALPALCPEAVLVDLRRAFDARGRPSSAAAAGFAAREPHARLVGPGIGDDARARAVIALALGGGLASPLAIDADGLNALDGEPERLAAAPGPVVVTPHPGEAARLLGHAVPSGEAGRAECAVELARRGRCIAVLKGAGTVVTDGERVLVNRTGNAGMATGGAGDVLAGILVAYLALTGRGRGEWTPFDAAAAAVHVHGLAGDLAAARLGRRAVMASDLVALLPDAQRAVDGEAAGAGA